MLKQFLISAAMITSACSYAVSEEDFQAHTFNKAGGKIVITGQPCTNKLYTAKQKESLRSSYSFSPNSNTIYTGCWGIYKQDGEYIVIFWDESEEVDERVKIYHIGSFTIDNKTKF